MWKTVSHWRSILRGGFQTRKRHQTVNKATARIQLFMLFNGTVSMFPVVQHQATAEASNLVVHTRVVKPSPGEAPFGDGNPGGERGVRGHPVELTRQVVLYSLLAADRLTREDGAVSHGTLDPLTPGPGHKSLGSSFVHE